MVQFGSRCESDTAYISQALSRGTQRVHAMRIVIASLFSRASTRHWRRKANPGAIIVDRLNIAQTLITASTRVWHNAGEMLLWQMPHVFTGLPTFSLGYPRLHDAANLPNSSVLIWRMRTTRFRRDFIPQNLPLPRFFISKICGILMTKGDNIYIAKMHVVLVSFDARSLCLFC